VVSDRTPGRPQCSQPARGLPACPDLITLRSEIWRRIALGIGGAFSVTLLGPAHVPGRAISATESCWPTPRDPARYVGS